jgi:hypothetical protein
MFFKKQLIFRKVSHFKTVIFTWLWRFAGHPELKLICYSFLIFRIFQDQFQIHSNFVIFIYDFEIVSSSQNNPIFIAISYFLSCWNIWIWILSLTRFIISFTKRLPYSWCNFKFVLISYFLSHHYFKINSKFNAIFILISWF